MERGDRGTAPETPRVLGARVLPFALPLALPWRTSAGERRERRGALLRIRTAGGAGGDAEDGLEGLGEAAPLPGRTEPLEPCLATLERVARTLRRDGPPLAEALAWLEARIPELGTGADAHRAARSAVATALFDLAARVHGRPLAAWLVDRWRPGGTPAERVPLNATLLLAPIPETAERARRRMAEGFRCLKLKTGGDAGEERERVRAVREAVGGGVAIRLDANGAWRPDEAARRLEGLAPHGIDYVEQPLSPDPPGAGSEALLRLAALRRTSPVRLAVDESAADEAGARAVLEAGAADVLVLKPATLGGPDVALRVAERAARAGVEVVVTTALDGAVGRAAALHTAAALGPGVSPCGLATAGFLAAEVAEAEESREGGDLRVPRGPGLGARLASDGGLAGEAPTDVGGPGAATRSAGPGRP